MASCPQGLPTQGEEGSCDALSYTIPFQGGYQDPETPHPPQHPSQSTRDVPPLVMPFLEHPRATRYPVSYNALPGSYTDPMPPHPL